MSKPSFRYEPDSTVYTHSETPTANDVMTADRDEPKFVVWADKLPYSVQLILVAVAGILLVLLMPVLNLIEFLLEASEK